MKFKCTKVYSSLQQRYGFWSAGMLLGIPAALAARDLLISMTRESVSCSVSVVGLLSATLLPFLISAYAVSLSEPWLLLIFSTVKAFCYSFCAIGVSLAFGQSSWLVRFLFLFSDYMLLPLLYLYWLRHIKGQAKPWELPACIGASLMVGCIDYFWIAPFLASLIES